MVNSTKHRIAIVGNGMVAHAFCKALKKKDLKGYYSVRVFGDEPRLAYDRVNLTSIFKDTDEEKLYLSPKEWYKENDIDVVLGELVSSIYTQEKTLVLQSGAKHEYDSLILATGSKPFVPNIEGSRSKGVFVYRTLADIEEIMQYSADKTSGVVIGGGLLGLEAAQALRDLGIESHVIQNSDGLMNRQLFPEGAEVLTKLIEDLGVNVHLNKYTEKIQQTSADQLRLDFSDGSALETEMVIISTGIIPRDDISFDVDIRKGVRGGYIINDALETSEEAVYAIGECALHRGQLYGLVAPCYEMAETLANRFIGDEKTFEGADLSCRLKVMGVEVSSCGDYLGDGDVYSWKKDNLYRMIITQSNVIVGASTVGVWDSFSNIQQAIADELRVSVKDLELFQKTGELDFYKDEGGIAGWSPAAIICNCTNTTKGVIANLIEEGFDTPEKIANQTRASTVCGSCQPLIAQILGLKESDPDAILPAKKSKLLLILACVCLILTSCIFFIPKITAGDSVQTFQYQLSQIWTDRLWKQITGFSLLGLSLFALILSLRKRVSFFNWLNFGHWRSIHSALGVSTLFILFFHTGLSLGQNLNLMLMICFLALNTLGGMSAVTIAMENKWVSARSRMFRHYLTRLHIFFFWPYPVLLGYHIFKAYYY